MEFEKVRETVENFCRLDFEGARLSSNSWSKIRPLIAYEEELGWDTALGILAYQIDTISITGNKANVVVRYEIVKAYPSDFSPSELKDLKVVQFNLVKKNNNWLLSSYILYPRVSNDILCNKFNECK